MLGSTTEPKEVVEYVVFENHIARKGSTWRLHQKIYPEWTKPEEAIQRPTLISNLGSENRPQKTVPIGDGWSEKIKRDKEKFEQEQSEEKAEKGV